MQEAMPNNNEQILNEHGFIVSKTDLKGKICYCNRIFIQMSQYSEAELIGTNHNIIRHPDMPKIAFKTVWDLIQSGKEFFGFVKNLQKNGGYYWVFANITPDFDQNGNIIGYTSVRRKPNQNAINAIIPIYQKLISLENNGGISASEQYLTKFLKENNTTYEELIINLQEGR